MDISKIDPIEVEEICREYRRAENPARQIQISSELHLIPKEYIRAILISQGYSLPKAKSRLGTTYLTYNGKTLTFCQWAKETGIPQDTLRGRYNRGWSIPDILNPNKRSNDNHA